MIVQNECKLANLFHALHLFSTEAAGVRHGCVLAPTLFNTCIFWVMGERVGMADCGTSSGEATITDLNFADDFVIFAETSLPTPWTY